MMHDTQRLYAIAKAAYETALAAYSAEVEALKLDWDADFDAANDADEAVRAKHQIDALREALRAAEDAMIDWSAAQAARAFPVEAVRVAETVAQARRNPRFRDRLIDLAFRLAA